MSSITAWGRFVPSEKMIFYVFFYWSAAVMFFFLYSSFTGQLEESRFAEWFTALAAMTYLVGITHHLNCRNLKSSSHWIGLSLVAVGVCYFGAYVFERFQNFQPSAYLENPLIPMLLSYGWIPVIPLLVMSYEVRSWNISLPQWPRIGVGRYGAPHQVPVEVGGDPDPDPEPPQPPDLTVIPGGLKD